MWLGDSSAPSAHRCWAQAWTLLVQLINVPVMLRLWGPELYGEWLMLSAIPTYLMLSDLGFGNVAGSAMTMRVHAGDRAGARTVFQSTMALVGVTSTLLAAVVIGLVFLLPLQRIFGLHAMPAGEARGVLVLLSLNTLVVLQWSVLVSAYRATERYATGMLIVNLVRVLEGAGVFIILFTHARPACAHGLHAGGKHHGDSLAPRGAFAACAVAQRGGCVRCAGARCVS